MRTRHFILLVVFAGLVAFDPAWIVPDWSNPIGWAAASRPEDVVAAAIRLLAVGLTGSQLLALTAVNVGSAIGNGVLTRLGRRALLPVLRGATPIVLAASTALPAAAAEARLPIAPPVERVVELPTGEWRLDSVVVERGDSMWTIAADHAPGDVGTYWRQVVDMNRDRFTDVNLIHPGDVILLPPV